MAEFQGKRVSRKWKRVLTAASESVSFRLNSGRRSMREQWALFRENMIRPGVPKPGKPMTAVPLPTAPHIWLGLANHALDIDQYYGDGEQALQNWLKNHGVDAVNNVAGEGWHLFAPLRQLRRLNRCLKKHKGDASKCRR